MKILLAEIFIGTIIQRLNCQFQRLDPCFQKGFLWAARLRFGMDAFN